MHLGLLNENEAVVEAGLTVEDRLYLSLPTDTTGMGLQRLEGQEALASKSSQ